MLIVVVIISLTRAAAADDFRSALLRGAEARDQALETESRDDWWKAFDAFETARAIERSKEVLFELANAASQLGLDDEAYAAYEEALKLGLTGEARELALDFVRTNERRMARLQLEGPAGARVTIRDRNRGTLPFPAPLVVLAGFQKLEVHTNGLPPWELKVPFLPGEVRTIRVGTHPIVADLDAFDERPLPNDPPVSNTHWSLPVLVAGSALTVASVVITVVANASIENQRELLAQSCVTLDGDHCQDTSYGKHDDAQRAVNNIYEMKVWRGVAIAGTVVGTAGIVVGLIGMLTHTKPDNSPHLTARVGPTEVGAVYVVPF